MTLINGNCLEIMKDLSDNSIDLLFCDLPYGQTSCKWDCLIDLELFWKQVNRICKDETPLFFTCSTKFGVALINSNPKNFRYDLVWVKSSPCGFLNAKKMPMKKHEMVYVFYKKLPKIYTDNIAEHHTHKFIKETANKRNAKDGTGNWHTNGSKTEISNKYDPPLPTSVIKDDDKLCKYDVNKNAYGGGKEGRIKISKNKEDHQQKYDPPLPTSVIKEGKTINTLYGGEHAVPDYVNKRNKKTGMSAYDPPLPTSVIKDENVVIKDEIYGDEYLDKKVDYPNRNGKPRYEPALPNTILEIASQKGKHATQKPVDLIKWCLKYYSKEGDTILDPTMGSGSTGVACNEMNRKFIGIEMDETIFKVAQERVNV